MTTSRLAQLVLPLFFLAPLRAQTIDFEVLPSGGVPAEGDQISAQFASPPFNVTFSLLDVNYNLAGTPVIAAVGGPEYFAFQGPSRAEPTCGAATPTQRDMPARNQNVGCRFLTDDGNVGSSTKHLFVSYSMSVTTASGALLDIDANEAWRIRAYRTPTISAATHGSHVAEVVLCSAQFRAAPDNASVPCLQSALTGDGIASQWVMAAPTPFRGVLIEFISSGAAVGLAFDNFSPSAADQTCDSPCCLGSCCVGRECVETTRDACAAMRGMFGGERSTCQIGRCITADLGCFPTTRQECARLRGDYIGDRACPQDISR